MGPLLYSVLLTLYAAPAFTPVPPVQAARTDRPVIVDGLLDEEVWKSGTAVGDFTQRDPDQGVAPT